LKTDKAFIIYMRQKVQRSSI